MRKAGKHFQAISHLPDNPHKRIYWIVYNSDMIEYVETLIKEIKGQEYLDNNVTVVAKSDSTHNRKNGTVYFDPSLLDLLGNGNV